MYNYYLYIVLIIRVLSCMFVALRRAVFATSVWTLYFEVVYLVTALVPSLTACLANSPGGEDEQLSVPHGCWWWTSCCTSSDAMLPRQCARRCRWRSCSWLTYHGLRCQCRDEPVWVLCRCRFRSFPSSSYSSSCHQRVGEPWRLSWNLSWQLERLEP